MTTTIQAGDRHWRWIRHDGDRLYDVGTNADGTLHNPNNYPADTVRAAIAGAEQRLHERRSKAAKKAAQTRQARKERLVYETARRIVDGHVFGPRRNCCICGRGLGDEQSIERGIGSECWQLVLDIIRQLAAQGTPL
jgi:hypothetical protein